MTLIATDVRGVAHAWRNIAGRPHELLTFCGVEGQWQHLTAWWSPLVMIMLPGEVDCMACLVAEVQR